MKRIAKYLIAGACGVALVAGCLGLAGCGGNSSSSSSDNSKAAADYTLVKDGTLTIGTSPDFPPFENLEDGKPVGFDIALGEAIAKNLGLEFDTATIQFDGIIPALVAGGQCDVGLSGLSVDPEREKQVDFTESYYIDDQAIAVLKDGKIASDKDLNAKGIVIAVQTGTTGEDFAKENYSKATVKGYGNSTDAFAAMEAGKADAVITNKAVVDSSLSAYDDAEVLKTFATGEEYAIAVSKDNPKLTEAINGAIEALKADGTIDKLQAEYLG